MLTVTQKLYFLVTALAISSHNGNVGLLSTCLLDHYRKFLNNMYSKAMHIMSLTIFGVVS